MEASPAEYSYLKSLERFDEILNAPAGNFSDSSGIPPRSSLTYTNGYYVDVTVLFLDMCESTELSSEHNKPVLAKIYRALISESIAVLRGNNLVNEIYIEGDGVWAVFNTKTRGDIHSVINTSAKLASMIEILNIKLRNKGYREIKAGIGIDDGESLMIKAGYNTSGINEIVWIGKVVGKAAKLCKIANRNYRKSIIISSTIYSSLADDFKAHFTQPLFESFYEADLVNEIMDAWVQKNA